MAADPPDSAGDMSQDDIDAAFASAGEPTEGSPTPSGDSAPASNDSPEGAASPPPEPTAESTPPAADSEPSGEMPQADIDAALAAAGGETEGSQTPSDSPDSAAESASAADSESSGEMSQADIDAALAAAGDTEKPDTPDAEPAADAPPSDSAQTAPAKESGAFSQGEIDAALAAAQDTPTEKTPAAALSTTTEDGSPKLDSQGRPFDEAAAMMEAAIAEEREAAEAAKAAQAAAAPAAPPVSQELPPLPSGAVSLDLPDFAVGASSPDDKQSISLLNDVQLDVKIELGRSMMLIEDVLKLGSGSVVELDKLAGDPVDVLVNDRLVARGEVLILNDNFCVRISEILVGAQISEASA